MWRLIGTSAVPIFFEILQEIFPYLASFFLRFYKSMLVYHTELPPLRVVFNWKVFGFGFNLVWDCLRSPTSVKVTSLVLGHSIGNAILSSLRITWTGNVTWRQGELREVWRIQGGVTQEPVCLLWYHHSVKSLRTNRDVGLGTRIKTPHLGRELYVTIVWVGWTWQAWTYRYKSWLVLD